MPEAIVAPRVPLVPGQLIDHDVVPIRQGPHERHADQ